MDHPCDGEPKQEFNSRYALVMAVARRAKQLKDGAPQLVECESSNPITIALKEIREGLVKMVIPTPEEMEAVARMAVARTETPSAADMLRMASTDDVEEEPEEVPAEEQPAAEAEAAEPSEEEQAEPPSEDAETEQEAESEETAEEKPDKTEEAPAEDVEQESADEKGSEAEEQAEAVSAKPDAKPSKKKETKEKTTTKTRKPRSKT